MKISKQRKASKVDRISNLPDEVLQLILSRLQGTEEVIRTSILSTRWRYLWTLVPSIDIDCSRRLEFDRSKFKRFVHHVLANSFLDLDSFRLSCLDHYNQSTIWGWVQSVVARNIKHLHLLFHCAFWFESIALPNCLVNCGSLEVLRLFLYRHRLSLPKFTGFPVLKILELNNVELYNSDLIKRFFKSCPSLEDLSLIDCVINELKLVCISCPKLKNLRLDNRNIFETEELYDVDNLCGGIMIDCPKLVSFEFGTFVARKYIFKSIGLLEKLVIHPEDYLGRFMDYGLWFAGVSHLESLSSSFDILFDSLCPRDVSSSLPNLKTLKLTTGIVEYNPNISELIKFLKCHPHLESLHLIIYELDEEETRSILTCHLKKVEFLNFNKQKLLLDIARSLLEHSNALEELVFRWNYFDEAMFHERSMDTMKELSKCHKASSTVKLIYLDEY